MKHKDICDNYLMFYKGPLSIDLISFMANYLKNLLKNEEYSIVKRIFQIFIELTQNVSYYSAESVEICKNMKCGVGWFGIKETKDSYLISTGNLILKEHEEKLRKNCNEINSLDEDKLRILKRKTRSQSLIRDVGAHIGLIQSSLISRNKLNYYIESVNDKFSFFEIEVKINKFSNN